MAILGIPNELLLTIAEYLSIKSLNHFLLTCRRLKILLTPLLYKLGLKDISGLTALQWATQNGHAFLAEQAILGGADIEKLQDWSGLLWTPLHVAAHLGHSGVASILTKHGANVAAIDSNHHTPLHLAANSGHSAVISTLVEHGADAAANDLDQQTPLHLATNSGHSAVFSTLVKYGANINARDTDQDTPLHVAVLAQNEEAIKVLLELGADMLCLNDSTPMPVNYAAYFGYVECMKAFIDAGFDITSQEPPGNRTVLHDAAYGNETDIVEYLLGQERSEIIVNARQMDGATALHLAVSRTSRLENIRLLLQHGADMEAMANNGYTPVHLAVLWRNFHCLKAFIEAGFDTSIRGGIGKNSGRTILHEVIPVVGAEGMKMLQYLLEQEGGKAIINAQDDNGSTPLHLAAELGPTIGLVDLLYWEKQDRVSQEREKVRLLVQYGANLKIKDKIGNTPAHVAAYRGDIGRMQPLLDCGLDFNSRGLCNRTILHAAVFGGKKMLEYLLSQQGIEMIINAQDSEGSTPLHLATLQSIEKEEMVELLLLHSANPEAEDGCRAQSILDCPIQDKEGLDRKRLETLALRCREKGAIEFND